MSRRHRPADCKAYLPYRRRQVAIIVASFLERDFVLMWNKRKEDEYPPKSASTPASSANLQRETHAPMTTAPASSFHSTERGTAVVGKSVMIKGQIFSREDLTVDGEVEGSIELHENRLTVGPHGKVQAGVKAREIVVLGTINGNV